MKYNIVTKDFFLQGLSLNLPLTFIIYLYIIINNDEYRYTFIFGVISII